MLALRKLLFPLSLLYGLVIVVRHFLYDKGIFRSVSHPIPVISIGNLSFGGTGKTPMTEYIVQQLQNDYFTAILSRGYKRTSKGFYLADRNTSAEILGDEPYQYHQKFPKIYIAVDSDRNRGVRHLMTLPNPPDIIVLDDAFQHRKIAPGLNILLTTYANMYVDDLLFPAGNLRDAKRQAKRADSIVITKCPPQLSEREKLNIKARIHPKPHQEVFFTSIAYDTTLKSADGTLTLEALTTAPFTLVTGIANPKPLVDFLKEKNLDFEHLKYPDHHKFSGREIAVLRQKKRIVTTEKDYARLQHKIPKAYYLPIRPVFLEKEAVFNALLQHYIARYT
ncbi:MAG: tetraacyldisaccharide 4'-kinase [Bacteroidota bacterium]